MSVLHTGRLQGCAMRTVAQGLALRKAPLLLSQNSQFFEQGALHFHVAPGPAHEVARPDGTLPSVNAVGAILGISKSLLLGAYVCIGGTMLSPL